MSSDLFNMLEEIAVSDWTQIGDSFESLYDENENLDITLVETYEVTRNRLGIELSLDQALEIDRSSIHHYIESDVGDDEVGTTDSHCLGVCRIGFDEPLTGVKLSWKDAGLSRHIANYAEGWFITPPTIESSFEAVNRRHARSGVPFTFDPVKLKLLSPVRKQSGLEENDLESKFQHLAEIASWTDPMWFTYDYHQMALLLANTIFDFEDAKTFPYLYKTEGGCGGTPPYGNLDTVYSAMHYYTRGKSLRALVGVMEETVAVNTGSLSPGETFFLRSSHLANMGDKVWLKYESAYRSLLEGNELSAGDVKNLLAASVGTALPEDISAFGTEIKPDRYTVGSAISQLRQDGLIMSELDVKLALDAKQKELAVFGTKPIGQLKSELEEEERLFKSNHWKILNEISAKDPRIVADLKAKQLMLPCRPNSIFHEVLFSYYRIRSEIHATYSSFFYTDTVRVFKTEDIKAILGRTAAGIRYDFDLTDSFQQWKPAIFDENVEERSRKTRLSEWLNSKPLGELLNEPLPPGVGPDDARIARNVIDHVRSINQKEVDGYLLLLFSGDRQLARATSLLVRPVLETRFVSLQIDRSLYASICLAGVDEFQRLRTESKLIGNEPTVRIRTEGLKVKYYNFLLKIPWYLPEKLLRDALNTGGLGPSIIANKARIHCHIEYDYPNMERGLDLIKYQPSTNTIELYSGGFLERRSLRAFRDSGTSWSALPVSEIKQMPDFDLQRPKRYFLFAKNKKLEEGRFNIIDPLSPSSYGRTSQWLETTYPTEYRPKYN